MSKSKHAAQEMTSPAPDNEKKPRLRGGIQIGWRLTSCLIGYAFVALVTRYGLVRALAALFDVWGVHADTVQRAPAWAGALYVWHGPLCSLAYAALLAILARGVRRLWGLGGTRPRFAPKALLLWAMIGTAVAVAVAALCLVPDSMRLAWPLSHPRWRWAMPVLCLVSLAEAAGEGAFLLWGLWDGLSGRVKALWATVAVCVCFMLTNVGSGVGPVGILNALLLGWVGVLLYRRCGFWTAVGLRWGWNAAVTLLLGFGGGENALYRLYHVSEGLLTGGDAGIMQGLWATLTLCAIAAVIAFYRKNEAS